MLRTLNSILESDGHDRKLSSIKILTALELIEQDKILFKKLHDFYYLNFHKTSRQLSEKTQSLLEVSSKTTLETIIRSPVDTKELIKDLSSILKIHSMDDICPVCHESFYKMLNKLEILPYCGHFICGDCLRNIESAIYEKFKQCPTCRHMYSYEVFDFKDLQTKLRRNETFEDFLQAASYGALFSRTFVLNEANNNLQKLSKILKLYKQIKTLELFRSSYMSAQDCTISNELCEQKYSDYSLCNKDLLFKNDAYYEEARSIIILENSGFEVVYKGIKLHCKGCKTSILNKKNQDYYACLEKNCTIKLICSHCIFNNKYIRAYNEQKMKYVPNLFRIE